MKRTKKNSKSYVWGEGCTAWQLVNTPGLSVIRETMPPQASELLHKHRKSQQFFYVLSGTASFELDGEQHTVSSNEGMYVSAGTIHCITNSGTDMLELLVISEPHSHADRIDI